MRSSHKQKWLTSFATAGLICWLTQNEPFFWDTIQLGAMHGDWFYQQTFQDWLLPDRIDSGHIPFFGWYLASLWLLFEQSLLVSHWAMFPWLVLFFWQWLSLADQIDSRWPWWWAVLLVLAAPMVLGHFTLMSPDVLLLAFFVLAVNSILRHRHGWLALAIIGLGLISLRGMMVAIGLFAWQAGHDWSNGHQQRVKWLFKHLTPYLPGAVISMAYLSYHYFLKGWIGVHNDSPWAASFSLGTGWSWLRQTLIVGWRLVDFGHVFLWLGAAFLWWQSNKKMERQQQKALGLLATMALVLALPALLSPGLAQHRYLLPVQLALLYFVLLFLATLRYTGLHKRVITLLLIGVCSGHLWVYPANVSQGWDVSLLHKVFFIQDFKKKNFVNEESILTSEIGSHFPFLGPEHYRYLNNNRKSMLPVQLDEQRYIYYSNISNDFSDQDLETLQKEWVVRFQSELLGVRTIIYERKD